jgi:hypothetical protein
VRKRALTHLQNRAHTPRSKIVTDVQNTPESKNPLIRKFASLGITVKAAAHINDLEYEVTFSPVMFGKLTELIGEGNVLFQKVQNGSILALVKKSAVEAAVEANAKAPRAKRGTPLADRIHSKTVYMIDYDETDRNHVAYAEFDGELGYMTINGTRYEIQRGTAAEFYEVGAKSDPDRTVYYVTIELEMFTESGDFESEFVDVRAYSVKNLVQSIMAIDEQRIV